MTDEVERPHGEASKVVTVAGTGEPICRQCGEPVPCSTQVLTDAYKEAVEALRDLKAQYLPSGTAYVGWKARQAERVDAVLARARARGVIE